AFTPLRQYVPGYGDVVQREEMADLQFTVNELTDIVEGQNLYIENLKRTMLGEAITVDSVEQRTEIVANDDVEPLPPSESEIKLRREMEEQRMTVPAQAAAQPSPGSNDVTLASVYLVAPLNGEVSAGFNLSTDHTGVDILAPQNTAVKATRAGIVFLSEFSNANGNMIGIQHDNNLISFYKHNSRLLKDVGDRVKAGEAVAIIGNTGTQSTGPHLHFELWHEGRAVDPGEFVSF
ncbi:MAG: M23 family metallopeptidase, partial [Lewinella sp.]